MSAIRLAPCRFCLVHGFVGREAPDGLCRAAFVWFMALLAGMVPDGSRRAAFVWFMALLAGTVPDGSRRAAFGCFLALPEGARSFYSLARSFPVCRPCRPSRLFLGVGTSVSRGLGKGYDSDSFQQRFRGRVRLGPALPDFRF